jgi:hypothetical protein
LRLRRPSEGEQQHDQPADGGASFHRCRMAGGRGGITATAAGAKPSRPAPHGLPTPA